jgi:putative addiction module component (TIGR02574 family)
MEIKRKRSTKGITAADALKLSIPERIQLVEDIWDTISARAEQLELTDEEKRVIDERLESYHRNPSSGSPWDIVLQRVSSTVAK